MWDSGLGSKDCLGALIRSLAKDTPVLRRGA